MDQAISSFPAKECVTGTFMAKGIALVWHSLDLRVEWNGALSAAAESSYELLPVYIFGDEEKKIGGASLWWLFHALQDLDLSYRSRGSRLHYYEGDPLHHLINIVQGTGANALYMNARFDPPFFSLQEKVRSGLEQLGVKVHTFNGNYLIDPNTHFLEREKPYAVFTPFYKACQKSVEELVKPPLPKTLFLPNITPALSPINVPHMENWTAKLTRHWIPTRERGLEILHTFLKKRVSTYSHTRDFPALDGTSSLSPYLHFGQISPHEIKNALKEDGEPFLRQLYWREFGSYFLFHHPSIIRENWKRSFDHFPWEKKGVTFKKWTEGLTGYPIVDAGMRQLWETGWMHNRVRMVVASFLTKDLLIHWKDGERWFWDTLVDADRGNNVLGWQWVAGCGPDAAPYFRIFNPVLQGEKFDPEGDYVRTYCPELKHLPSKWIHKPWQAPEQVLSDAGIRLGTTYPHPIVDHSEARDEALKRYKKLPSS